MTHPSVSKAHVHSCAGQSDSLSELERQIEHASHYLPSQGPITVFVHHNTLHAFEDDSFDVGVRKGATTYGCHPYLAEDAFRRKLHRGRITPEDLATVLADDLGEDADRANRIHGDALPASIGHAEASASTGL